MTLERLLSIRWATVAAYIFVWFVGVALIDASWWQAPMGLIVVVVFLSNCALTLIDVTALQISDDKQKQIAISTIVVDMFLLFVFLYFYGGYTNPFSMMFLVYICIASLLLSALWTWIVFVFCSLLYVALFFWHISIPILSGGHDHHHDHGLIDGFSAHLYGMLFSFLIAGTLMTFFLTRMRQKLDERQQELLELQQYALTQESLSRISALTAQSAHELSTPIATMSLIAESLTEPDITEDEKGRQVLILQRLISQCRKILGNIRERFQASAEESATNFTVEELINSILARLSEVYPGGTVKMQSLVEWKNVYLTLPRMGLELSLTALVDNAAKYGKGINEVEFEIKKSESNVEFKISDSGPGINSDGNLEQGNSGSGLGVGIFLAKQYFASIKATLHYVSRSPFGTTAIVSLPYGK